MKWKLNKSFLNLFILLFIFVSCKNGKTEDQHEHPNGKGEVMYTCPMHPEVMSTDHGNCPKCDMALVPVEKDTMVQINSPAKVVLSRQATIKLTTSKSPNVLNAEGYISIDSDRNATVAARFGGRIEKLFVRYNGQYTKKGSKIMEIYSPEIRTIQEEHLFLKNSKAQSSLLEKSREKLRLLGISEKQINLLEEKGIISTNVTIYNPKNGFIFFGSTTDVGFSGDKNNGDAMQMSMNSDEGEQKEQGNKNAEQIREGNYVRKGQQLFLSNDLNVVWALIYVSNEQINSFKKDDIIEIQSENKADTLIKGKVLLSERTFEENKQRFARIRIEIQNQDHSLKINTLVKAKLSDDLKGRFMVPSGAVLKTGRNNYVWVKKGETKAGSGIFHIRKVNTGMSTNGLTVIEGGLYPNEEIALQAGLMTDSETLINTE